MRIGLFVSVLLLAACGGPHDTVPREAPPVATFSIVGFDPATGDVGVAVQSKVFGVGAIVPYARADVGAVATQAFADPAFGPQGLRLMDEGLAASLAVERLIEGDPGRARRQLGMVDARGRPAAYTGTGCKAWAGHVVGAHHACQGNLLAGEDVVKAMSEAFTATKGPLAERLVAALRGGQAAGGDKRGRQSAALLVARRFGGYGGKNDRYIDIRVEDHPTPIEELARLLVKRRGFLPEPPVPKRMKPMIREPRVGTSLHPSARETWLRWKGLHAHRDWQGIHALCVTGWRLESATGDDDVDAVQRAERKPDTSQALARRGVYLGTDFEGTHAKLYFAVRGAKQPVMVLMVKEEGAWRIVP